MLKYGGCVYLWRFYTCVPQVLPHIDPHTCHDISSTFSLFLQTQRQLSTTAWAPGSSKPSFVRSRCFPHVTTISTPFWHWSTTMCACANIREPMPDRVIQSISRRRRFIVLSGNSSTCMIRMCDRGLLEGGKNWKECILLNMNWVRSGLWKKVQC